MAQRLADRCRQSFSVKHWQAGIHYHFVLDAAKIAASDEFGLQATVKAGTSRPDRVSLDWSLAAEDALLLVSCTCSSYRQGELCGHIVATIFEADRRYLGARVPGRGTLDVIDEAECEWELDDEIQEDIGSAVDRCENRREVKPAPKRSRGAGASKTTYRASAPPNWQSRLQRLTRQVEVAAERFVAPQASVKGREIWYRLNASETAGRECLVIDFQQREHKLDGEFGKRKPLKLSPGEIISLPDALDRELLSWMIGNRAEDQYSRPYCGSQSYYGYRHGSSSQICRCELAPGAYAAILPRLCQSGRLDWLADARSAEADEPAPLAWDEGPPWQFKLQFGPVAEKHAWRLTGVLYRPDETAAPDAVRFADAGVVLFQRTAARLAEDAAARWIAAMRAAGAIEIAAQERDAFLKQLWQAPELPPVELAPECESAGAAALSKTLAAEPVDRVLTLGKHDLGVRVAEQLQTLVDRYALGITIRSVDIGAIAPPAEVADAFDRVVSALRQREQSVHQAHSFANKTLAEAKGGAQRLVDLGAAERDRAIRRAQGETDRFLSLLAEYEQSPELTAERLYLETMAETLPKLRSKLIVDSDSDVDLSILPKEPQK